MNKETKLCKACGIEKSTDLFYENPKTKDKLFPRCKKCITDNVFIEGFDKDYIEYKKRLGEVCVNNEGYEMEVIEYNNANNIVIKFLDKNGYQVNATHRQFKLGNISNPYHKSYLNVGYFGEGGYKARINGKKTKAYVVWGSMLTRCYKDDRNLTYNNVTVCEEWLNFQNFAKWFEENYDSETMQNWQLDKDVICKDCKTYSPDTCCFIPQDINFLFTSSKERDLPKGVSKTKYGYKAINFQTSTKNNSSKTFKTVEEALDFYTNSKKLKLETLLQKYTFKNKEVYNILKNFNFKNK
jgi:hypothetical protein